MRRVFLAVILFPILNLTFLCGGCSGTREPGLLSADPTPKAAPQPATGDEVFREQLAEYMELPATAREDLHAKAKAHLKDWEKFENEARQNKDATLRHWYYQGTYLDNDYRGVGLGNSIQDLKAATGLDPSFAEAWGALGRLCAVAGDLLKAREYFDKARQVAMARQEDGQPVDHDILLEIYRDRAWVLRDLGLWDLGLDAVTEGLRFHRGDPDLVLIKGLMLAGAGRYEEATSLAVRMKPLTYPRFDVFHYGVSNQTSDFANRWIRSQALMAIGDYEMALHVIGNMESYPYRWFLPHQQRFWNDVGLVAELVGDGNAGTYYALGFISSDYRGYFPWGASNLEPLVLDVPGPEMPYFASFGNRFHVGGSLLSYGASQLNLMAMSLFEQQRSQAAWRALEAFNLAERRHIRPDVVQAMRGRLYFAVEDLDLARRDLTSAHDAFKLKGQVDAGTSLLLGLLEMEDEHYSQAVTLLEETVTKNDRMAVGWRSLGVSLARLGRKAEAERAMDRSLQLEPRSVSGLYNRGLLHLQSKEFDLAAADLDRAFRLDPENHEVQRLLQMAAAGHRSAGGDPQELRLLTEEVNLAVGSEEAMTSEEMLASLEADIESFFAVPDSVRTMMGPDDQVITGLQEQWATSPDPLLRRILALAYMDRGRYEDAQKLLAPGWGVDLSPEEEVMLLYVDRTLGEEQRSRDLANMMIAGEFSSNNPYLLMLLPQEDRKHWTHTILAHNHFYEGYGVKTSGNPDAIRYARYMRLGFRNMRVAQAANMGIGPPVLDVPFFRYSEDRGGLDSANSGAAPTSGSKSGNVIK